MIRTKTLLSSVKAQMVSKQHKMKGADQIIDAYVPIPWVETYKMNKFEGMTTKAKKSFKKYIGLSFMKYYKLNGFHSEIKDLYKELYEGIASANKARIANVCSPLLTQKMQKKIIKEVTSEVKFTSIDTSLESVNFMIPKVLKYIPGQMEQPGQSYEYLFQLTMKVSSILNARTIMNGKENRIENEKVTEYIFAEKSKSANYTSPWRLCGIMSMESVLNCHKSGNHQYKSK
eukprot:NODE_9_length_64580_cov_1.431941.p36 type:complete len:231 gc:universal NODE_9_length_64580_cov_1.431941:28008-27316(-)